ncbi:MAG: DUF1217 domain-containing protein [Paracoccaceae bacterium]
MTGFQPIVPLSGYSGWQFLVRTADTQKTAFDNSAQMQRDIAYFKENIGKATTAKELVSDYRLLKIALGAFGLDDDIGKKAYVLKALEEGTDSDDAFANRIVDKRYRQFAKAFGYGNQFGAKVGQSNFAQSIITPYKTRQFEIAVGDSNQSMRLAMSFTREIPTFANSNSPDQAAWFEVMGNPPLKKIFETAFGLPRTFGAIDIDRQRQIFKEKSEKMFGSSSLEVFKDPANVEKLLRTFFVRKQIAEGPSNTAPGSTALTLLQNAASGMNSLFQSRL